MLHNIFHRIFIYNYKQTKMKLLITFILLISLFSCTKSVDINTKSCWTITYRLTLIPANGSAPTTATSVRNVCDKSQLEINDDIKDLNKTSVGDLATVVQETIAIRN